MCLQQQITSPGATHELKTNSVDFEVRSGFATITLVHPEAAISKDALMSLSNAVRECARRTRDISAVFLLAVSLPQLDHVPQACTSATHWQEDVGSVYELMDQLPQAVIGFAAGPVHSATTCLLLACDIIFATSDAKFSLTESGGTSAAVPSCMISRFGSASARHMLTVGPWMDAEAARDLGLVADVVPDVTALRNRHTDLHDAPLFCPPGLGGSAKQVMRSTIRGAQAKEAPPAKKLSWKDSPAYIQASPLICAPCTDTLQTNEQRTHIAWKAPPEAELPLPKFGLSTKPCQAESCEDVLKSFEPMRVVLDDALGSEKLAGHLAGFTEITVVYEEAKTMNGKTVGPQRPPKRKDLISMYETYRGPITSIMICNLPCRLAQAQLAEVVDNLDFSGKYDYLYLPTGGRSSKAGVSNLGYGFINFPDPHDTEEFYRVFAGYKFDGPSLKEASLRPAHAQGHQACENDKKDQSPDKQAARQVPRRARRSRKANKPNEQVASV